MVVLFNENIYVFVFVVVEEFRKLMLGLGLYSDIQLFIRRLFLLVKFTIQFLTALRR